MKKCPRCGKIYDDSWTICLNCSLALTDNISIRESNPELREKSEAEIKVAGLSITGLVVIVFAALLCFAGSLNPSPGDVTFLTARILALVGCCFMNVESFDLLRKNQNMVFFSVLLPSFLGVGSFFFINLLPVSLFCAAASIIFGCVFLITKKSSKGSLQVLTGLTLGILAITFFIISRSLTESRRSHGLNVESRVSFLKDGKALIFNATVKGKEQIFRFDLESRKTQQLTYTGENSAPAASPNRDIIIFVSDRDKNNELYAIDADGSNERRLTFNKDDDYPPSFSPDGTRIVFQRMPKNYKDSKIVILDVNNNEEYQIMSYRFTRYYQNPIFMDDNTVRFESAGSVYLIDVSGKEVISKTEKIKPSYYPMFSPDRKKVAFEDFVNEYYLKGSGGAVYEVFVADPDGNNRVQVTNAKSCCKPRAFTPDGKNVVFLLGAPKKWGDLTLWQVDINGANLKQLKISLDEK